MIKLDIINEVVNKTGITKSKAEAAVETVFESMKKALANGDRIAFDQNFSDTHEDPFELVIGQNPQTNTRPQALKLTYSKAFSPRTARGLRTPSWAPSDCSARASRKVSRPPVEYHEHRASCRLSTGWRPSCPRTPPN